MIFFGGTYNSKLDDKGRTPLPAPFRRRLEGGDTEQIVCRCDEDFKRLKLFTMSVWEEECQKMYANFDEYDDNDAVLLQDFFKKSYYMEIESVSGRILLNKTLKDFIKAKNEVCFVGNGKYINIYKKEDIEENAKADIGTEKEIKARLKRVKN